MKITGKTLIDWGFKPNAQFKQMIAVADQMARDNHFGVANHSEEDIKAAVTALIPLEPVRIPLQDATSIPIHYNIDATTEYEIRNLEAVKRHVDFIAKSPVVKAIAAFPDACPSGTELGTIPVGVVAVTENAIVPQFHSADVCCSMAATFYPSDTDPKSLMDTVMKLCHFGEGPRTKYSHDIRMPEELSDSFESNTYLRGMSKMAEKYLASAGSSNHLYSINRSRNDGKIAIVSHYGSRKVGGMLYSKGVEIAQNFTNKICPEMSKHCAWIPFDTQEGQDYWEALQLVRKWTIMNHFMAHEMFSKVEKLKEKDSIFNEHNFCFKREKEGKNYIFHAKGATPMFQGFSSWKTDRTIIPANMTSPILICKTREDTEYGMDFYNHKSLGMAPHGSGRLYSRGEFRRLMIEQGISESQLIAETLKKVDARAYKGKHDVSEFAQAYKDPEYIINQIEKYELAEIIDYLDPLANVMVGTDGVNYRELKAKKKLARNA